MTAARTPDATALRYREEAHTFAALQNQVHATAIKLLGHGLCPGDRVAIFCEKRSEAVVYIFATALAGGVFVPIHPQLKAEQVQHILSDCGATILVTTTSRATQLENSKELQTILLDETHTATTTPDRSLPDRIDADLAAILYTSGSTGLAKGVMLSHRNLVAGAGSVARYLGNSQEDKILALLPLSFDAGLSQLTTGFLVGAEVVLFDFLFPRDVARACETYKITGLTGVPPLWIRLATEAWPDSTRQRLRYFANTGGHMPAETLQSLRALFPQASPFLMYGLTEAFRSTFLDPAEVDARPDSIGKAIPNAEILILNTNGQQCAAHEVGELVHRGALVGMGYWNDPKRTAERFKKLPGTEEVAVWSGDLVRRDEAGFLYFVGRRDQMIKTSGYRVSPTEVEAAISRLPNIREAVALGIPHEVLGHSITVLVVADFDAKLDIPALERTCRTELPPFMVPSRIEQRSDLPRNPNGKVDRSELRRQLLEDSPTDQ